MAKSIRPWATAVIAVVGAGVVAVAPFEPLGPGDTIRITPSAVEIDSSPSPTAYYPQVVMRSLDNAGDRLSEYLAAPLPIVTAVAGTQYTSLTDIVDAVEGGDVVEIVGQGDVDGALVGGASLDGEQFAMLSAIAAGGPLP